MLGQDGAAVMMETTMTEDAPTLRRAGPADAAAVRDLTRAAYAKWVPLIGREPKPMVADYDHAVQAHLIDLMYEGADLVALIEMIPEADHLMIENVAVAPAMQRHGYGPALVAHAETMAAKLGFTEVRLYTNPLFAGNVALYTRLGYRVDREEVFLAGMVVHMSKRI